MEQEDFLSTEVTDDDIKNGVVDEYGVMYSRDGKKLLKCNNWHLLEYTIKEGTVIICDKAFMYNGLKKIIIPKSVLYIGDSTFYWCSDLNEIIISDSLISIGNEAFNGCKSLTQFDIPYSVALIGDKVFCDCASLQNITICDSVTSIGINPFVGCNNLELHSLSSRFIANNGMLIDNNHLISYIGNEQIVSIPNTITIIEDNAFSKCEKIQQIIIPNSVTTIGCCAFEQCKLLNYIFIPDSVTTIGAYAFNLCESLQKIQLPNSVTTIGDGIFNQCIALQQVNIPSNISKIGESAFKETSINNIVIPQNVTSIGNNAFEGCSSLQKIIIPNSVKLIGDSVFSSCISLQDINIPNSVTEVGNWAFANCSSLINVVLPNKSIKRIGEYAFVYCESLQNISIPDSVTTIEEGTFKNCSSLQNIDIPDSISVIDSNAFLFCKSLLKIDIPKYVTKIGENAFACCKLLKINAIPNSVLTIEDCAFWGCKSIKKMPNSPIQSIGENAFTFCKIPLVYEHKQILPKNSIDGIKIHKIVINNFRAYKNEEISLKNNFNCIIGKNDCGKSTIFAAMEWFFNTDKELNENDLAASYIKEKKVTFDDLSISVDVYFYGVKIPKNAEKYDYICEKDFLDDNDCICIRKYMFHPLTKRQGSQMGYSIKKYPFNVNGKSILISDCSLLQLRRICEELSFFNIDSIITHFQIEQMRNNERGLINKWFKMRETKLKHHIYKEMYTLFIKRGYEIIKDQWIDIDIKKKRPFDLGWFNSFKLYFYTPSTPITDYLNNLLTPFNANQLYTNIEKEKNLIANKISQILKDNKVSDEISFRTNEYINFFSNDSLIFRQDELPINIPLKNRGEGLQLTIKNAVFKMLAEKQSDNQNTIFAFEEPETHLHPSAQIEMYKTIKKLSENSNYQVFMTTHSPYIVKELAKDNIMPIVVTRDEEKQTSYISKLDEKVLSYDSMNEINYIAFGEPSIAYHIELFGFIHNKLMNKYENDFNFKNVWDSSIVAPDKNGVSVKVGVSTIKGVDVWLEVKNGAKKYNWYETKNFTKEKRTLPYCVRNNIDHPLTEDDTSNINKHRAFVNNAKFEKYIQQSIDIMRNAIINNPNVFK